MSKVTVLSPVHIGTGAVVDPVCYRIRDHRAQRYDLAQITSAVKLEDMSDPKVLRRIMCARSKNDYYRLFNTRNIEGDPQYTLQWDLDDHDLFAINGKKSGSRGSNDIYEQVKTLGKPVIPGSTIKGAIECAFKYNFLKSHLTQVKENYASFAKWPQKPTSDLFWLQLVYGNRQIQSKRQFYSDFINQLYGCLSCPDLIFKTMAAYRIKRYSDQMKREPMGLGIAETIAKDQVCYPDSLFEILEDRCSALQVLGYASDPVCSEIMTCFLSRSFLIESLQVYQMDLTASEKMASCSDLSYDEFPSKYSEVFAEIDTYLNENETVQNAIVNASRTRNTVILRLGKYTGYFYKTVSWLFRNEMGEDFIHDFKHLFSPSSNTQNPKTFPATISLFYEKNENSCLILPSGYIQVEI